MSQWVFWLGAGAHIFFGVWSAGHALLNKRDPRAALGWCVTCLLIPLGGPLAYLLFGINRVRRRAKRLSSERAEGVLPGPVTLLPRTDPDAKTPENERFARCGQRITQHPIMGGNEVEPLHNGEEVYPAMLKDIASARRRIWLATYIFDTDRSGNQFITELKRATERGIDVRVLVDGFGQLSSLPLVSQKLKAAEIPHVRFLPPRLWPPLLFFNLRNHRKILIVDDDIAYVGGINISDRHIANQRGRRRVIDMHFRIQGPVADQLANTFREDWQYASGEKLPPHPDQPAEPPVVDTRPAQCRIVTDGPDRDLDNLAMLLQAITATAEHSLKIMTPYFLPDRALIASLKSAAVRGVAVTVILPIKSDLPYMTWATRNMLWELLEWGVRIYYQPPPFVHSKLIIADGVYSLIGSANIDARSLRLNFEVVAEIFDPTVCRQLTDHFDGAMANSRPVTLDEVDGRALIPRLRDSLAWLFAPYL